MTHLDEGTLWWLAAGGEVLEARAAAHLAECATCREEVELLRHLKDAAAAERDPAGHPGATLLVRLADGALPSDLAETLRQHLERCGECAREHDDLVLARSQAGPFPGPMPRGPSLVAAASALVRRLRELADFEMPLALALTPRSSAPAAGRERLEAAMSAYRDGDHARAAADLRASLAAGEAPSAARFYLGACLMREGRPGEAVRELEAAVAGSPRLGEYRWLLAQAHLAAGNGPEALEAVRAAAKLPGRHRARARALATHLAELLGGEQA